MSEVVSYRSDYRLPLTKDMISIIVSHSAFSELSDLISQTQNVFLPLLNEIRFLNVQVKSSSPVLLLCASEFSESVNISCCGEV